MAYLKTYSLVLFLSFIGISIHAPSASAQIFGNKSGSSEVQKSVDALQAAMMEMQRQFEQVKAEKAQLRGELESLQKQSEELLNTQKLYFKDVDTRLAKVEPQKVEIEGLSGELAAGEKAAYEAALKSFQEGQFDKADTQFTAFIQKFPSSPYLPIAMYWLGNTKYALKEYSGATVQFEKLIAQFPNHQRVPGAMLMMANCQLESGNKLVANLLLSNLVSKYPNSPAAAEAKILLGIAPTPIATPAIEKAAVEKPLVEVAEGCPSPDASIATFKPTTPTKTGDFVYVVSKNKQVLCVKDSTGKIDRKVLDEAVSPAFTSTLFYGKAPFLVMSNGLGQLDIFFQGQKIPMQGSAAKSIQLEESPIP
jgi:tol-pal system protein YbgF